MKVALDEHISPALLDAVRKLLENERHGDVTVVGAKNYAEPPAKSDIPWLKKFKDDGGEVIVTADKRMRANLHERAAIQELGLVCFFVPPQWPKWKLMRQSGYLILWWEVIVDVARKSSKGECWLLHGSLTPTVEAIKNVTGPKETKPRGSAVAKPRRSAAPHAKHAPAS